MDLAVGKIVKAFRVYQNQLRIGELNRQSNLKTIQGQVDRVDLSSSALEMLKRAQADPFSQVQQFLEAGPTRPANRTTESNTQPAGPALEDIEFRPMDFSPSTQLDPPVEPPFSEARPPAESLI